ncbi:MAG: methylated-DNA--[protein]-cysteine S-methyltransferase [Dehalococcoidales bacterium]|nr:methylated-DNA--[protein]-cysteine S-methyltransferase [Dehalococcoidales bacterium]
MEYRTFETAFGIMAIAAAGNGLAAVALPCDSEQDALSQIDRVIRGSSPSENLMPELIDLLKRYFKGERVAFDVKLDFSGATDFQRRVWQAARRIPYGESRSYGWVAAQAKNPRASRAAGNALGRNPFPVIVPCHRVIAGDGTIGGFSSGLAMKRRLLALESIRVTGESNSTRH